MRSNQSGAKRPPATAFQLLLKRETTPPWKIERNAEASLSCAHLSVALFIGASTNENKSGASVCGVTAAGELDLLLLISAPPLFSNKIFTSRCSLRGPLLLLRNALSVPCRLAKSTLFGSILFARRTPEFVPLCSSASSSEFMACAHWRILFAATARVPRDPSVLIIR